MFIVGLWVRVYIVFCSRLVLGGEFKVGDD